MNNSGTTPRDEAELDDFLNRQSPLSEDYDALELVDPPEVLDAKVLAAAKAAIARPAEPKAAPASKAAPVVPKVAPPAGPAAAPKASAPAAAERPAARPPVSRTPATTPDDSRDDPDDDVPARRPRWLVPAALAASVLVAVGIGISLMGPGGRSDLADQPGAMGSMFAERARERGEASKAAADAAAAQEAEAVEVEIAPLPPPPVFEPEGPQVEDLDSAIGVIRKELLMADQGASEPAPELNALRSTAPAGAAQGSAADTAPAAAPGVIQPRNRRLAKILELYDGGNPDLAADSLEIFLRDFEDDPITQRILDSQPKATDVAVE